MSIRVVRVGSHALQPETQMISIVVRGQEDIAEFEKLISRGISTWDQAAPQIKVAADEIRYGKAQQDYHAQGNHKIRPE